MPRHSTPHLHKAGGDRCSRGWVCNCCVRKKPVIRTKRIACAAEFSLSKAADSMRLDQHDGQQFPSINWVNTSTGAVIQPFSA